MKSPIRLLLIFTAMLLMGNVVMGQEFTATKAVIPLEVSTPKDTAGGLIAADINDDGARELLITAPGYIGAYGTNGKQLWSKHIDVCVGGESESKGLPGHHGPGVQAGDINGDRKTEVVFFDRESTLHVLRGGNGQELWSAKLQPPAGAQRWEHVIIANFRGKGDRDLLMQATNAKGYRTGRYLAAYSVESLQAGKNEPLWQRNDFVSCAHNGARLADLDGDGRDEVLGATILGPDGELRVIVDLKGHLDSIFVGDVRPELPGLEVVMLEEGRLNRIFLVGISGLIWEAHHKHQEPQNAAIGRFIPGLSEMQIWCRSRFNEHQTPFVLNAHGALYSEYKMDDMAPKGWTLRGVEVINSIYWSGEERMYACAKERHRSGDVCIFDPVSGRFLLRLPEKADRLYVADVSGDWREEIIVWSGNELHIYSNPQPNPRPEIPRLWTTPHYRRSKMTWNYYSP
ncbi:MAG: hypothetical protein KJ990_13880 [Proteobacteria bacterium]|nr:hypothetical protein [Pseudomonadota bacterium]MBU1649646.1 hypothetical protein [Pseudomonadota bacterium]